MFSIIDHFDLPQYIVMCRVLLYYLKYIPISYFKYDIDILLNLRLNYYLYEVTVYLHNDMRISIPYTILMC